VVVAPEASSGAARELSLDKVVVAHPNICACCWWSSRWCSSYRSYWAAELGHASSSGGANKEVVEALTDVVGEVALKRLLEGLALRLEGDDQGMNPVLFGDMCWRLSTNPYRYNNWYVFLKRVICREDWFRCVELKPLWR